MSEIKLPNYDLLQPHEQRVVQEYVELNDKHTKLTLFITTQQFSVLLDIDKELLRQQHDIMRKYLTILEQRIVRFLH